MLYKWRTYLFCNHGTICATLCNRLMLKQCLKTVSQPCLHTGSLQYSPTDLNASQVGFDGTSERTLQHTHSQCQMPRMKINNRHLMAWSYKTCWLNQYQPAEPAVACTSPPSLPSRASQDCGRDIPASENASRCGQRGQGVVHG